MRIKVHFLNIRFPESLSNINDKRSKSFHQVIKVMEERNRSDRRSNLKRHIPDSQHSRK